MYLRICVSLIFYTFTDYISQVKKTPFTSKCINMFIIFIFSHIFYRFISPLTESQYIGWDKKFEERSNKKSFPLTTSFETKYVDGKYNHA